MDTTILPPQVGEILEKGQQAALSGAKTVVSDVSNSVSDQVGLKNEANSAQTQSQVQNTLNQNSPIAESSNKTSKEDLEMTKEMVSDYYSPSQIEFNSQQAELEEQQTQVKLAQVRQELYQELHNETYFNEILHAGESKPGQQVQAQEQQEEQKQMEDLQVSQKKNEDLAKFRAERQVEIKGDIVG